MPRLVEAMHAADDFVLDSMAQVHLPAWSRGRVVLLGDAAWCPTPLSGLGTSLALVGAYVLAGELAAAADPGRGVRPLRGGAALLRGAARRSCRPAAWAVSHRCARWDIRLRTASMRLMTRRPFARLIAKQFEKAGDLALPDYDLSTASVSRAVRLLTLRVTTACGGHPHPPRCT